MKRIIIASGIVLLLYFTGCSRKVSRREGEMVHLKENLFESLYGQARLEYETSHDSGKIESEIYIKRPDQIRIDIFMPFVGNAARILIHGNSVAIYDFVHRQIILPANKETDILKEILGISIDGDILYDALLYGFLDPKNPAIGDTLAINDEIKLIYQSNDLDFPPEILYFIMEGGENLTIRYEDLQPDALLGPEIFITPQISMAETVFVEAP